MTLKFSQTDAKLIKVIRDKDLSDSRIREYDIAFKEIYDLTGYTPTKIIEIGKKEQKPFNNNGIFDIIDIDDREVTKIQDQYYEHLRNKKINGRPLMDRTIKTKLSVYRAFLKANKIEMPDPIKLKIPKVRLRDKDIPTWNDVNNALNLCKSPRDSAIIAFAVSTGLRISDILNLKLKNIVESCSIYFDETEEKSLVNLLKKNPDNIVPCWEVVAQKTSHDDVPNLTITFNTPEASRYIWFYLKDRFNREKKKDSSYTIDLDEPLFKSQRGGHLSPISVETHFRNLNARLGGEKDKNGVFIKFRLHNLRKLFKTTCRRNISSIHVQSDKTYDGDVISLFTGHTTPNNPLGYVYEAVEDDSHDSHIRKVYQALIPYLSIQPTEVKDVKTEQYQKLEEKNEALEKQLEIQSVNMQREMDEQKAAYEQKIRDLEAINVALSDKIDTVESRIDNIARENDISAIMDYASKNEVVNKHDLMETIMALYDADYKAKKVKIIDENYKQTLVNRALLIKDQLAYDPDSPEIRDERLEIEYGKKYINLKKNVHNIKNQLLETKYPDLQLTKKNNKDVDCALVKYMEKLLEDEDYPTSDSIERVIFDTLNIFDDVELVEDYEYIAHKEKKQAEAEELEKLHEIEKEKYGLDE